MLGLAYVHHSTTGFALPALLPLINQDLALSDSQGALLTVGYTVRHEFQPMPLVLATWHSARCLTSWAAGMTWSDSAGGLTHAA